MNDVAERRLHALDELRADALLSGGLKGVEKESLRVTPQGHIALTPHPAALGSALTHPYITTDFSEALIELITPPFAAVRDTLAFLEDLHRYVYQSIDDELLWSTSMPCMVGGDESVPIARYGTSNIAKMKQVYRTGLSHRYGSVMQTIAGVHFNYSLPEAFWPAYHEIEGSRESAQAFRSRCYFDLVRNFHRHGWLISLLFGASPAVCKSFLPDPPPSFEAFDHGTLYQPHATSLRMSDIGYKGDNQASLYVSYDSLDEYVACLEHAIETPFPEYERIGVQVGGEYRQLNANLLQIENEFYSFIRPKQIADSGEKPTHALRQRGVRYVEVRALDIASYDPIGVSEAQLRVVEALLIHCLLASSPPLAEREYRACSNNQRLVACCGRHPELILADNGHERPMHGWALEILGALRPICARLDAGDGAEAYSRALAAAVDSVADPARLPSTRLIDEMRETGQPFFRATMNRSSAFAGSFRAMPLTGPRREEFAAGARRSLERQREVERSDTLSFDQFLAAYFAS
ncbi:MAG: glutamate--cysteine ligase [Gammaproteobacteria bacterium]